MGQSKLVSDGSVDKKENALFKSPHIKATKDNFKGACCTIGLSTPMITVNTWVCNSVNEFHGLILHLR